jgi:hypothetical protein
MLLFIHPLLIFILILIIIFLNPIIYLYLFMKLLKLEELVKLEKKIPESIKENITTTYKNIIQDSYDLKLASLLFRSYLPDVVKYSLKNLNLENSYMYLRLNDYISNISFSPIKDEKRNGFIGEYNCNNLNYVLLKVKNVGSVTFEHDDNSDKALTGPFSLIDLFKSKGISHFIQAKNPFVHLKNRIFRGMGMSIYEKINSIPNIGPNSKFGYDLGAFTFMPASIIGEEGGMFDHVGFYKKFSKIIPDKSFSDYLSKNKSLKWTMTKGGVFLGPNSLAGGIGSGFMPGSIIGKHSEICLGAIVRGYVPPYHRVIPNANYYCYNKKDLDNMIKKEVIKKL